MTDEKTALNGTTITTTILDQNLKKKKKGYTPLICATDDSDNEEDISEITSLTCGSSSSRTSKERKKEKIRELGIGPIANGDNIQQEKTCMVSSKQHASTPQHIRAQNNTGMVPPQQEQIKVPLELQNYNGMPTKKDKAAAYSLHIDGKRTRKPRKFFVAESSGAHNITNNNDNDNDSTFINSSKRKRKASVLKKLNSDHVNTKDTKNSRIALLRLHRQSNIEVRKGLQFRQNFTHTTTYTGKVISKESQEIWNAEENEDLPHWTVEFDDGEIIDILESELKKRVQETATEDLKEMGDEGEDSQDHNNRTYIGDPSAVEDYEIIKQDLIRRATYSEEEVVTALDTMTVPYCLNTAVKKIMDDRDDKDASHSLSPLGRQLYAVEVFCGCAIVSEEFDHRKWRVRAFDNDPNSRATHQVDFMNFTWASIMNVPDFIWLSPPCFTYSKLAGGKHSDCNNENYSKTPEARDHDRMLWRILWMLKFMIKKKPHMIIMIEVSFSCLFPKLLKICFVASHNIMILILK